jgi:hypothetical protein
MARYRRTIEDSLKEMSGQARATTGLTLSIPELQELGSEYIGPNAILAEHLAEGAVLLENLDQQLKDNLANLEAGAGQVDDKIAQAINDSEARPITEDRLPAEGWSIWPFVPNTIPAGSLAPGAIGQADIADFSITVAKINDDRHRLY